MVCGGGGTHTCSRMNDLLQAPGFVPPAASLPSCRRRKRHQQVPAGTIRPRRPPPSSDDQLQPPN